MIAQSPSWAQKPRYNKACNEPDNNQITSVVGRICLLDMELSRSLLYSIALMVPDGKPKRGETALVGFTSSRNRDFIITCVILFGVSVINVFWYRITCM